MKTFLLRYGRNFYVLTSLAFVVWMLLFDGNDLLTQVRMRGKLREMEAEKSYYTEKIAEVKQDRAELMGNPRLLEKFAREKYLMKKPTEEVFVTVNAANEPVE